MSVGSGVGAVTAAAAAAASAGFSSTGGWASVDHPTVGDPTGTGAVVTTEDDDEHPLGDVGRIVSLATMIETELTEHNKQRAALDAEIAAGNTPALPLA